MANSKLSLASVGVFVCGFLAYCFWVPAAKLVPAAPAGNASTPTGASLDSESRAQQQQAEIQTPGDPQSAGAPRSSAPTDGPVPEALLGRTAEMFAKAKTLDELVDLYMPLDHDDSRKSCALDTAMSVCNVSKHITAGPASNLAVLREFTERYCRQSKSPSDYVGPIPPPGRALLRPSRSIPPTDAEKFDAFTTQFIQDGHRVSGTADKLALKNQLASIMHGEYCEVGAIVNALSRLEAVNYREHLEMVTHIDHLRPEEFPVVFRLATRMVACANANPACAPGGLLTVNFCMHRLMCAPGLSLMEAYRLTHSPLVYESAQQIADYYARFPYKAWASADAH